MGMGRTSGNQKTMPWLRSGGRSGRTTNWPSSFLLRRLIPDCDWRVKTSMYLIPRTKSMYCFFLNLGLKAPVDTNRHWYPGQKDFDQCICRSMTVPTLLENGILHPVAKSQIIRVYCAPWYPILMDMTKEINHGELLCTLQIIRGCLSRIISLAEFMLIPVCFYLLTISRSITGSRN